MNAFFVFWLHQKQLNEVQDGTWYALAIFFNIEKTKDTKVRGEIPTI